MKVSQLFQPREIVTYADLIELATRKAGAVPYRRVLPTRRYTAWGEDLERLRRQLRAAQEDLCGICGTSTKGARVNLDHVVPRYLGGLDPWNRLLVHVSCNERKGHRPPTGCELIFLAAVNARLTPSIPGAN